VKTVRCNNLAIVLLSAFCLLPFLAQPTFGQTDWVGRKFMPKEGCVIKIGTNEIAAKGVPLPYLVEQVSGDWLWIGDGWVQKARVVPLEQAAAYYSEYLRTHPNSAWAMNLRGWLSYEGGDYDKALQDYSAALRLNPQDAVAYNNRGRVWQQKGEYDNALKDYNQVIRLDPRETMGFNSVAWLLSTCPSDNRRDGSRALTLARKACELSNWKDAYSIDTLAAAYAESGNFEEAIRWQTKAAAMLAADDSFVNAARERLALYHDHQPYREPAAK
jgi:tetratricopeptide (TPR) repeat protein